MKQIKKVLSEIADALCHTNQVGFGNIRESFDILLVGSVLSLIIFLAADILGGRSVKSVGVVVDKVHKPAKDYMTFTTTTDSNGNVTTQPVFHHDPPEWKFILRDNSANIVNAWSSEENYYHTNIGDQIPIVTRYGRWTHWVFIRRAVDY